MAEPATHKPLAPLTTLDLGGTADWLVQASSIDDVREALRWAGAKSLPVYVLGGGSNVVVADEGIRGLVLRISNLGVEIERRRGRARVTVAAGEIWDDVVRRTVGEGLAGIECLSGIPGTAGATPIQNVGAYGQEVATVISRVHVLNRDTMEESDLDAGDCDFGYRSSRFRQPGNPHIILEVVLELEDGGPPNLSYHQVAERFNGRSPDLAEVRAAILDLRRSKSMVIDNDDPNGRSVGSFFVNPVVDDASLESVKETARTLGVLGFDQEPAGHRTPDGRTKLSAAWLIESAGFPRGCIRGRMGISTKHALALIHRGEGTASELVEFAREIRRGVRAHLGIDLRPEPVFLGFDKTDPTE